MTIDKKIYIPYGHQAIDEDDIQAVVDVLRSDYLTTGPKVNEFEQALADYVESKYAVAVSSGTAALHCAMYAIGIGPGDEVIVPPITFAATANCVVYQGGTPVFADVSPDTLLIDPIEVEKKITPKTKAIIGVDYAGQPCDWDALRTIADKYNLVLVEDGCHALGAEYKGKKVGTIADMTIFSFHPVKHITTGEGGMITTNTSDWAEKIYTFRNHGITTDHRQREETGSWFYEMTDLGFNYRITDFQCALGISQLKKLPDLLDKRIEIADQYNTFFSGIESLKPLLVKTDCLHAYHLYVVKLSADNKKSRQNVFNVLRNKGIGVNVHYIPVHLHPFYQRVFGYQTGDFPVAENAYASILSLPIFPDLNKNEIECMFENIKSVISCKGN
jgi:perosamine synthetase